MKSSVQHGLAWGSVNIWEGSVPYACVSWVRTIKLEVWLVPSVTMKPVINNQAIDHITIVHKSCIKMMLMHPCHTPTCKHMGTHFNHQWQHYHDAINQWHRSFMLCALDHQPSQEYSEAKIYSGGGRILHSRISAAVMQWLSGPVGDSCCVLQFTLISAELCTDPPATETYTAIYHDWSSRGG